VENFDPPPVGFDLRIVQPVASRYTDYATSLICGVVMGYRIVVGGVLGGTKTLFWEVMCLVDF